MNRERAEMIRSRPFCPGCGCWFPVHGGHRADCPTTDEDRVRLLVTPRRAAS